jgi:putative two-component system response regulator
MQDLSLMTILIVDDVEENIDVLVGVLGEDFDVSVAMDGESALECIEKQMSDLILLDIMMPGIDGYGVIKRLKSNPKTQHIPVIFMTALTNAREEEKGLNLGAIDYITKPFSPTLVKARVKNQLELKLLRDNLEDAVKQRTLELELTQELTIESMGTLAEYRDPETGGHIKRTKNYIKLLAEKLKSHPKFSSFLTRETIEKLCKSAPLHDIGKVGISDQILLKPGKLTDEEFDQMKKHTIYGRDALNLAEQKLGKNSFLHLALEMAESHQEKWDGSGYPNAWSGYQIPIPGRLMAVADVYDALISRRVYKKPFPHSKAVEIILEGKGQHFDPDVVDAFMEVAEDFRNIATEYADFEDELNALMN